MGTVVEVGEEVSTLKVGDFVIGSFMVSDSTCEICQAGFPSHCANAGSYTGSQAEYMRIEQADGTLVVVPGGAPQDPERLADYLAASDVLGTGWFSAVAAQAGPGKTIAVVGDGAVGLSAVLAAKTLGAEKVIAFSRHEDRAQLAREFGADVVIAERGEEGAAKVKELTGGLGAHGVCEAVGTRSPWTRPWPPAAQAVTSASWASPTTRRSTDRTCSSVRSTCWAGRLRCAASCLISSSGSRLARSTRQGLHLPHSAGAGGRGLQGHGRAPRDQGDA